MDSHRLAGRLLSSCALLACFLLPAARLLAQGPILGDIVGQIRLSGGKLPSERILVELQARGATIKSTYADNEGRFAFYQLPYNAYRVVVRAEGYLPFDRQVIVRPDVSPRTFVPVILAEVESKKAEAPPEAVAGANPHLVDFSQYAKQFPREAVKQFEAGVKADEKGKTDRAVQHYQEAIRLAPDFYPAHNNLGTKYLSRGEFQAAEAAFSKVIELNQNDAQAYFNLGNVLYLTNRLADAAPVLQEGLERQPNSALGNYLLGTVEVRTGRFDLAERHLRSAAELDPKLVNAHLELANLYLQQQRAPEAVAQLKIFIEESPDTHPLLPRAREVLKALSGPAP